MFYSILSLQGPTVTTDTAAANPLLHAPLRAVTSISQTSNLEGKGVGKGLKTH